MVNVYSNSVLFRFYLRASFFLSVVLYYNFKIFGEGFGQYEDMLVALVLTNAYAYFVAKPYIGLIDLEDRPIYYFLLHYVAFLGLAAETQKWELIYLSEVPLICGVFYKLMSSTNGQIKRLKQATVILTIGVLGQIALCEVFFHNQNQVFESIFSGVSLVWKIVPFIGLYAYLRKISLQKTRNGIKSERQELFNVSTIDTRDSLFFHDIINSTHGLILFLSNKAHSSVSLDKRDIDGLVGEVRTIQTLIKDHFHLDHKNLNLKNEFVNINTAIERAITTIEYYLPKERVETSIIIDQKETISGLIFYPAFYRIFNNLIKNISDQNCKYAEFIFSFEEQGVNLKIKNQIYKLNEDQTRLTENLSKIIQGPSSEVDEVKGLGLQSIANLCTEQGGTFRFFIDEGHWVTHIFLPLENVKDVRKVA